MFDVTIAFTDGEEITHECKNGVSFFEHGISIETATGKKMFFPYRNFYCVSESHRDDD